MRAKLLAALALLAVGAAPGADTRMTVAEADRLSPKELASRLLGAAGEARGYVEKRISANGGGMIASPGLNLIDLFAAPRSAGFAGLCEVEGVTILFEHSAPSTPGDPPHRVRDFFKFKRFLALDPMADPAADTDWRRLDGDCAKLGPVARRADPMLFALRNSDRPVDASFAMRAVAIAQATISARASEIACSPDPARPSEPFCDDPAAAVAAFRLRDAHYFDVGRCHDPRYWCVEGHFARARVGNFARARVGNEVSEFVLSVATDAMAIDPPRDFKVTGVKVLAATIAYD